MQEQVDIIRELLYNKNYQELKKYLKDLNSVDISTLFEELNQEEIIKVYRLLAKEEAAEVFAELDSDIQEKLINVFTDKEMKAVLDELYMDDTVDLIEEMPSNIVKRILKHINKEDRQVINKLLQYPDDSAGSMMTTEFIDIKENMTVEEALEEVKKEATKTESIYTCYVLTLTRKIVGVVKLKDLLLAKLDEKISDLMDKNYISIQTLEDQEDVAKMFDKYNEYALPVVDNEERLVGIITIDDAMDIMREEAEEDFEKMAAVIPSEEPYLKTPIYKHILHRIGWLLILMFSAILTGSVLEHYESAFATMPILVAFIPMIMGTGGNSGSQSSTIMIRAMATEEVELKDWLRALWKELRIGLLVGLGLFVVNSIRILIQYQDFELCLILGLSLVLTVLVAKSIGCLLPIFVKKIKLDPAVVAAPIITTLVDLCSIIIYFQIATYFMASKGVI